MKSIFPVLCFVAVTACNKQEPPRPETAAASLPAGNPPGPLSKPAPAPAIADDTPPPEPAPAPPPAPTLPRVDNPASAAVEVEAGLSALLTEITALAKEVEKGGDKDKLMARRGDFTLLLQRRQAVSHSLPVEQQTEFKKRSTPNVQALQKIFREYMDDAATLGLPSTLPIKKDPEPAGDTEGPSPK